MGAVGLFLAEVEIFECPDIAVGDDGYGGGEVDFADGMPVDGWLIALGFCSGVNGEPRCTGFLNHFGIFIDGFDAVPPESDFYADGDILGDGLADGEGDIVDSLGGAKDRCAAIVAVHGGRGAAEIDIDGGGSGGHGVNGGGRHEVGVAAKDLDLYGESGDGLGLGCEFGDIAGEDFCGEGVIPDADEFGDGVGECFLGALECAHGGIGDAIHGGEDECGAVREKHCAFP